MTTPLLVSGAVTSSENILNVASPAVDRPKGLGFSNLFWSLVNAVRPTFVSAGGAAEAKVESAQGVVDNDQVSQESKEIGSDTAPRFAWMAPFDPSVAAPQQTSEFAGEAALDGNLRYPLATDPAKFSAPLADTAAVQDRDGQRPGVSMTHQAARSEDSDGPMRNGEVAPAAVLAKAGIALPAEIEAPNTGKIGPSERSSPGKAEPSLAEGPPIPTYVVKNPRPTIDSPTAMPRAFQVSESENGVNPAGYPSIDSRANALNNPGGEITSRPLNSMGATQAWSGVGQEETVTGESQHKLGDKLAGAEDGKLQSLAPKLGRESDSQTLDSSGSEKTFRQLNSMGAAQAWFGGGREESSTGQSYYQPGEKLGGAEDNQLPRSAPMPADAAAARWAQAHAAVEDAGEPAWQPVLQRVTEQIAQQVRIGQQQAVIELEPAGLGKIRIDLRVEDEQIHARIVAEEQGTKALIESRLTELRQALEIRQVNFANLQVEQQNVSSGGAHSGQTFADGFRQGQGRGQDDANRADRLANETPQRENLPRPARDPGRISMWA